MSEGESGLVSKWLAAGAVVMFLLFAVLIGAGILGNGLFAEGDGKPPAASSGTGSEGDTQTPSPGAPSTESTAPRTTSSSQTEGDQPTSNTVADRTTTRQGTASTASDSFGTLTDRSPAATSASGGSESATPKDSASEATTGSSDGSNDAASGSTNYTDDDFSAALQNEGISVETLFPTEDPTSGNGAMMTVLEYTTQASESRSRDEASVVAQVYASAVSEGYGSQTLSVTVYTANDDPVAAYRIERAWAIAYANGDISGEEYGRRISDTYQSY